MPTTRPRHTITESDALAEALDVAARRWPQEPRGRLLMRLVETGARALADQEDARRRAVQRTSGVLTDAYPDGYLERLRDDWPA
jgi:hypothetical protein